MSSINFNNLVETFLLEAPQANWLDELIAAYNSSFNTNFTVNDKIITDCLGIVSIQSKPYYSKERIKSVLPAIHILDVLAALRKQLSTPPNSVPDFIQKVTSLSPAPDIKQITSQPWEVKDPDVLKTYNALMHDAEIISQAALETYKDKSIYECLTEIVKKRTDAFKRLTIAQNPFGAPFQSLIKDVLNNPDQYASGTKKVTRDFKAVVDDLYFQSLIKVGLRAKAFYASIAQPGKEKDLTEYFKILTNQPGSYTIGDLMQTKTEEAVDLVAALREIAAYTREKAGRGETIGKIASALGSLRVGMGPVN